MLLLLGQHTPKSALVSILSTIVSLIGGLYNRGQSVPFYHSCSTSPLRNLPTFPSGHNDSCPKGGRVVSDPVGILEVVHHQLV